MTILQRTYRTGRRLGLLIGAAAAILWATGCFQPQSGCLDINAVNFDASVDKNCCCIYPRLLVTLPQNFDTLPFIKGGIYPYSKGLFHLDQAVWYLSEVSLSQNGQYYRPTDSISLYVFGATNKDTLSRSFINDFMLVRREDALPKNLGTLKQNGVFDGMRVRIGLSDAAQTVIPSKTASSHPLHTQSDSLWISKDKGFVFARFIIRPDTVSTTPAQTITLTHADLPDFFLTVSGQLVHVGGYDFPVNLIIDYKKLFDGIDWSDNQPDQWKLKIRDNMSSAFSISQ